MENEYLTRIKRDSELCLKCMKLCDDCTWTFKGISKDNKKKDVVTFCADKKLKQGEKK